MFWRTLYNWLAVPLIKSGLLLAAIGSEKVRRGVKGRMGEGDRLRTARGRCIPDSLRILVHCASAGELESAIPLIRDLKRRTGASIILSYYSPSAVSHAGDLKEIADHLYMPFDSPRRVRRLLTLLEPALILVIKHDVWPNLVWLSRSRNVPVVVANAYSRRDSILLRWRWLIPFARELYGNLAEIHAVTEDDAHRFRFLAGDGVGVYATGDTRYDRVRERALNSRSDQGDLLRRFEGRRVFIAGSTWPADEKLLVAAWRESAQEDTLLLLVPHEPREPHLAGLERQFSEFGVTRLSAAGEALPGVLLVDRMGILAGLYGLGLGAYVGGGFGAGVHSVIEPAVFEIPVSFGLRHEMSPEAKELLAADAAVLIRDESGLTQFIKYCLNDASFREQLGRRAGGFVKQKAGSTERLVAQLQSRHLTSPRP